MAVEMGAPKRELYNEVNRLAQAVDSGGGGGNVNVVQTTGQSTTDVMSQKAITDLLEDANATFARKDGEYADMVVGKAIMAQVDAEGSYIPDKYAKKTELPTIAQGTGTSTTSVMSQKAVTDAIPTLYSKTGPSPSGGMTQKAITEELALKANLTEVLLKNGSDLVVGQSITSLVSGTTYVDCSISARISESTICYLYNCKGTLTLGSSTPKVYATNCPDLTINNWYSATVFRDGVTLLYDKDSTNSSLNWGYPGGIYRASGTIGKDFSPYKELIVYAQLAATAIGRVQVGKEGSVFSVSGSGNYWGVMCVLATTTGINVQGTKEFACTSKTDWDLYSNESVFYIYKIYGVLK